MMQKPTEKITIDGQEYPIHFGYAALAHFERRSGISFDKLGEALQRGTMLNSILDLAFCGFYSGHRKESLKFPFESTDDVADLLDHDFENAIANIMEIFERQYSAKEEKHKSNTEPKKK